MQLGPENDQALEPTFNAFYKLGLSLSFFLRHNDLLSSDAHIRSEIGEAFNDMLVLVSRVSIHYKKIIRGLAFLPFYPAVILTKLVQAPREAQSHWISTTLSEPI